MRLDRRPLRVLARQLLDPRDGLAHRRRHLIELRAAADGDGGAIELADEIDEVLDLPTQGRVRALAGQGPARAGCR